MNNDNETTIDSDDNEDNCHENSNIETSDCDNIGVEFDFLSDTNGEESSDESDREMRDEAILNGTAYYSDENDDQFYDDTMSDLENDFEEIIDNQVWDTNIRYAISNY